MLKEEVKSELKALIREELRLQSGQIQKLIDLQESLGSLQEKLEGNSIQWKSQFEECVRKEEKLATREAKIIEAEIIRDNNYAACQAKLEEELAEKRKQVTLEIAEEKRRMRLETIELHKKNLNEMEAKYQKLQKEQENTLLENRIAKFNDLEKEVQILKKSRFESIENEINDQENALKEWSKELERKQRALDNQEISLNEEKRNFLFRENTIQSKEDCLVQREEAIEEEIRERYSEQIESYEREIRDANDEIARIRENLSNTQKLLRQFESLKSSLGENPYETLSKLKTLKLENQELMEELAGRPSKDLENRYKDLKNREKDIELRERDIQNMDNKRQSVSRQTATLIQEKDDLEIRVNQLTLQNNTLSSELDRLTAAYKTTQNKEKRIEVINEPLLAMGMRKRSSVEPQSEINWLENIEKSSRDFGMVFPKRILYSFHTALKTADISPLTVLAGVSGTGKSELPRLYSHFGGINFFNLPVQPNWDSQESMLGFYNSIDNRYDAQEVLRLLTQSQRNPDDKNGLNDVLLLILLDEMNLSNVELYFSDFLSKLEYRRSCSEKDIPSIGIKIGSGLSDYPIKLGRNVLWAGTMNQDETTKTLSDKVIDRGIIINFPSPTKFERREQIKALGEPESLLTRVVWDRWIQKESAFTTEQINPYKTIVEDINNQLSKTGRALGHRVWQSIEYYMSNYPTVLEAKDKKDDENLNRAMKKAFEDQLVQKVMPKLRGIETRGSQGEPLKNIQKLLLEKDYNLDEDFNNAIEHGYGQFMWCTSNYLLKEIGL
jgi:hypothetical protein